MGFTRVFPSEPYPSGGSHYQIEGKVGKLAIAVFGNEVVVFQTDATKKGITIEPGFKSNDIADFECVVPGRIDSRYLVGI